MTQRSLESLHYPQGLFELVTLLSIGFTVVSAVLLALAYLVFLSNMNKHWTAVVSCLALLFGLCVVQLNHLQYLLDGEQPLRHLSYLLAIFFVPPNFYLFSRAILFANRPFTPWHILHFLPMGLVGVAHLHPLVPFIAFVMGFAYSLWLLTVIRKLKGRRRGYRVEFFFFTLFSAIALVALSFGLAASIFKTGGFYLVYANGITLGFVLVVTTLIVNPSAVENLTEAVKLSYASSTLANVEIGKKQQQLEILMRDRKLYQDESLSLRGLAQELDLSSHQLSELINTHFEMNFSRYIRQQRVDAAKHLLLQDKTASVLSISMEVGFKSQSNFYAAFKEVTGISPGQFRAAKGV